MNDIMLVKMCKIEVVSHLVNPDRIDILDAIEKVETFDFKSEQDDPCIHDFGKIQIINLAK